MIAGGLAAVVTTTLTSGEIQAADEQFIALLMHLTGPYAPDGISAATGAVDYCAPINERDGGSTPQTMMRRTAQGRPCKDRAMWNAGGQGATGGVRLGRWARSDPARSTLCGARELAGTRDAGVRDSICRAHDPAGVRDSICRAHDPAGVRDSICRAHDPAGVRDPVPRNPTCPT